MGQNFLVIIHPEHDCSNLLALGQELDETQKSIHWFRNIPLNG